MCNFVQRTRARLCFIQTSVYVFACFNLGLLSYYYDSLLLFMTSSEICGLCSVCVWWVWRDMWGHACSFSNLFAISRVCGVCSIGARYVVYTVCVGVRVCLCVCFHSGREIIWQLPAVYDFSYSSWRPEPDACLLYKLATEAARQSCSLLSSIICRPSLAHPVIFAYKIQEHFTVIRAESFMYNKNHYT